MVRILISLLTFAWHMNNTTNNQGDHCIIADCHKPEKLIGVDSNQTLLTPEEIKGQCAKDKHEIISELNKYAVLLFNSAE
ncbi:MAG: hypothetical protein BBJ57_10240 [Desulfobacterales bacterium PC51MH44]|nr:MAG: hypothetical protein BBJ57_10240 [Desulfobacterales bacterium PC51MH44]